MRGVSHAADHGRATGSRAFAAWAAVLAMGMGLFALPGAAQDSRVSFEVRGGYDFPIGDFSDSGIDSEFGFGANAVYTFTPQVSVYAGWGRDQFDCDMCGGDDDIHSSGFEGGVKLHPRRASNAHPWARIGAIYHNFAGQVSGEDFESNRQVGLQLGLGVDLPLGEVLSVTPAVRFNSWTAKFEGALGLDPLETQRPVRYLAIDIGARFLIP